MLATIRGWFAKEPRQELVELLGEGAIPSMQHSVLEILRVLRDPGTTPRQIGQAVSADPGVAVRVLRLVNSPAAGLKRRVDNIGHAATLLGRSGLESIVLGVAVKRVLPHAHPDLETFWRVAAHRATAAQALAARIQPADASLCFAGGLLQDLAVPLLLEAKQDYRDLLRDTTHGELALTEASEFGWTHAEVADWLCEAWGLPDNLRDAIAGHHGSGRAPVPVRLVSWVDEHTEDDPDALVAQLCDEFDVDAEHVRQALLVGRTQGEALADALAG